MGSSTSAPPSKDRLLIHGHKHSWVPWDLWGTEAGRGSRSVDQGWELANQPSYSLRNKIWG